MPRKKLHNRKSPRSRKGPGPDASLRKHLVDLLNGGNAHVQIFDALEHFPAEKRGVFAKGLPHTAWQLLEHLRIAQWDILEFSRNPRHVSPDFPSGYWPKSPGPETDEAWNKSIEAFRANLKAMVRLVADRKRDLYQPLPWGSGQTLLREALLVADHNSYHIGQMVDLKRALQIWTAS